MGAPTCESGPCRSPLACSAFGYCRQLNTLDGPVLIADERGVYPSALDRTVEEQRRYYGGTK